MHQRVLMAAIALAIALVATVIAEWPPGWAKSAPSDDLAAVPTADTRDVLAKARGEAARARERAAALDRQARSSTQASERATIAAAALAARVQQAESALAGAEAALALVSAERRALAAHLAREQAPVAQLLAGLQTMARRPALLTLLQPGSVEDAVHLRAVVTAVGPQIDARTVALRRAVSRVGALEREAARVAAQRRDLRSDLAARRRDLAAASAAERLKARRAAGAADREAERAYAIGEEARDLATLSRRLAAIPRDGGPQVRASPMRAGASDAAFRSYRLPVTGSLAPTAGGAARGLTIVPRPGALAVAPADGRVAFAGPYRGYGNIVILEHASGWTSLVTGLASLQVTIGQLLVAGSPLGQASARNPAIGLELLRNGERMNPLDQLR